MSDFAIDKVIASGHDITINGVTSDNPVRTNTVVLSLSDPGLKALKSLAFYAMALKQRDAWIAGDKDNPTAPASWQEAYFEILNALPGGNMPPIDCDAIAKCLKDMKLIKDPSPAQPPNYSKPPAITGPNGEQPGDPGGPPINQPGGNGSSTQNWPTIGMPVVFHRDYVNPTGGVTGGALVEICNRLNLRPDVDRRLKMGDPTYRPRNLDFVNFLFCGSDLHQANYALKPSGKQVKFELPLPDSLVIHPFYDIDRADYPGLPVQNVPDTSRIPVHLPDMSQKKIEEVGFSLTLFQHDFQYVETRINMSNDRCAPIHLSYQMMGPSILQAIAPELFQDFDAVSGGFTVYMQQAGYLGARPGDADDNFVLDFTTRDPHRFNWNTENEFDTSRGGFLVQVAPTENSRNRVFFSQLPKVAGFLIDISKLRPDLRATLLNGNGGEATVFMSLRPLNSNDPNEIMQWRATAPANGTEVDFSQLQLFTTGDPYKKYYDFCQEFVLSITCNAYGCVIKSLTFYGDFYNDF